MSQEKVSNESIVVKFAGDSGDGIQVIGYQFTINTAFRGNEVVNFPDFPAEIRAPKGTIAGVSGFQVHLSAGDIYTPGDEVDVLVVMNAASLKVNLPKLKKGGIIIANTDGFTPKNLKLAGYETDPTEDNRLDDYDLYAIPITKLTQTALEQTGLGKKEKELAKNMFVLGFLYWMFDSSIESTKGFLEKKFARKPEILEGNILALKAGYYYGNISEAFSSRIRVSPAARAAGKYRGIMGNHAISLGLMAASEKAGLPLFYGSYPITPASDILHFLSGYINTGLKVFQAEDEISAIGATIGAAYGGALAVTGTSGPGMALKTEAIGLATMTELPLVIVNVQRGGPSTGMPTKMEQSDLLQAVYGRNGECPLPVLASRSPADCFDAAFEAARIALEHMTPVILLSDGYLANSAEAWRFPSVKDLPKISNHLVPNDSKPYLPYKRDEKLARNWAVPGMTGKLHRIGGLEKLEVTGEVTYESKNHEKMVKIRQSKVDLIAKNIPLQNIDAGFDSGKVLILGWGSTYGAIKSAVKSLLGEGYQIAHAHLRYIQPFPDNLGEMLARYDHILIPENNNGQLVKIIRDRFLIPAIGYSKIQGSPFTVIELKRKIREVYEEE